MKTFQDLGLSQETIQTIHKLGLIYPTQIQELSIPSIMQGKDVLGESATGSGKTLAFSSGMIEKTKKKEGIQALVLTPTRELAEQIKTALRTFVEQKHLEITAVYGGVSIDKQVQKLRKAEIVIATPGRLLDHISRRTINLQRVKTLVLDEADRMLDMGFIQDVEEIINNCPRERQTLFFSATISSEIKHLAKKYMKNPEIVSGKKMVDPAKLKQVYLDIPKNKKISLLVHLLQKEKSKRSLAFCNTRKSAEFIAKILEENGIKTKLIHGGLTQNKRNTTIERFHHEKEGVLVCTDVASRGLHIDSISYVYNVDIPKDAKDYIHRIGRTARAGEEGKVINLLSDNDYNNFSSVLTRYREFNIEKEQIPNFKRILITTRPQQRGAFQRERNNFRR